MIKHILTKPNFSGYTYTTDFYSDAIYKVLTYLHNFDHTLISKRTNIRVNAFAYISQIIHNSIVFIIKKKQNERIKVNHLITSEISDKNLNIINHKRDPNLSVVGDNYGFEKRIDEEFFIDAEPNLLENIKHISKQIGKKKIAYVYYPTDYKISLEEYYQMKPFLKYINVISMKNYDLSKLKDPIDVLKNKSQNAKL